MNLETFQELLSPSGAAALERAAALHPCDATLLACATRLRAELPIPLATAALETVMLRRKAAAKFARAGAMFFTREALEQSSSELVSCYRAERFAPFARVADFCCGVGGDTIGFAGEHEVVAVDADPLRLAMAGANLDVYGCRGRTRLLRDDVVTMVLPNCDAYFVDPDRRADGNRHVAIASYQPRLDRLRERLPRHAPLGVKVAPGVPHRDIEPFDAEAEYISANGELKECVLWFGPLRQGCRRATLLPGRQSLAGEPRTPGEIARPSTYLHEPDPAIIRAGLVANLGEMIRASLIDPEIAFLTSEQLHPTPFATTYRVDEWHPFHLKKLAARLRSLQVGRITLVKRGSAIDSELLTRRCKLEGAEHRVVILTRSQGRPIMLIGERVSP